MATIVENIQTLQSIKSDIKNAIIEKGGSVTDAFGGYAQAIKDLPSGGGDTTVEDALISGGFPWGYGTYVNDRVTSVRSYMFQSANISGVSMANVTKIGNYGFESAQVKTINFPKVSSIGMGCFANCQGLNSVILPSLTSLTNGYGSLWDDKSVITKGVFENAVLMEDWETMAEPFVSLGSLKYIGNRAFKSANWRGFPDFTNVSYIGDLAFIDFNPNTMPNSLNLGKCSYIGESAFAVNDYDNSHITEVTLSSKVVILPYAFYSTSINTINGGSMAVICFDTAFPSSILSNYFSSANYAWASAHPEIQYINNIENSEIYGIGPMMFNTNQAVSIIMSNCYYVHPSGLSLMNQLETLDLPKVETFDFSNYLGYAERRSLMYVNMGLKVLKSSALVGFTKLYEASFNNCTYVSDWAFSGCSSLYELHLDSVTTISNNAFSGCTNLRYLYMENISKVPTTAYTALTSIYSRITNVYVPMSLVASFRNANYWKSMSSKITWIEK